MDEFLTLFLFTDIGDYQTRGMSWAIIIVFTPVVLLFLSVLLNLRVPKQPSFINGKVYIGNTSLPTINLLSALIAIVLGAMILLAMGIFLSVTDYPLSFGNPRYAELQKMYNSHQYFVTEGTVHVIHAQRFEGHDGPEVVRIGKVELSFSFFSSTFGYHQTISRGGALTEGTYARVFYVENPPDYLWLGKYTILRVDIE